MADPEVLARGGELRGHKVGGVWVRYRDPALPRKFVNLKKMANFCALLSIDFKVCNLITETVSDHIKKTVTNRLCFPLLFQSLRVKNQELGKYCDSGYKQPLVQGSCSCQLCHDAGNIL